MLKKYITVFCSTDIYSFLLTISPSTVLYAQLAETPWPMFRHDLQHTGRSPYGSIQKPIVKWTFQTQGPVTSSPAIGEDGTIYFGSKDKKSTLSLEKANLSGLLKHKGRLNRHPPSEKMELYSLDRGIVTSTH